MLNTFNVCCMMKFERVLEPSGDKAFHSALSTDRICTCYPALLRLSYCVQYSIQ